MIYARPQESHADLGLVDNDLTEDLRPRKEIAPGGAPTPAEGLQNHPPTNEQES